MRPINVTGARKPGILRLNAAETGTKSRTRVARPPSWHLALATTEAASPENLLQKRRNLAAIIVSSRDTLNLTAGERKLKLPVEPLLVDEEEAEEAVADEVADAAVMDSVRSTRKTRTEPSARLEMTACTVF